MFALTIIFIVTAYILLKTAVVIHARECGVKERLGKFHKVLEPGVHFLIPFFDKVAYKHDMREQVLDVPAQTCITKDNIQVSVDGVIYIKVMDAELASYGIEDFEIASVNLAQTTMRSEIGKMTLHKSFSERESLNQIVVEEIDKASNPWGIKVLRYEIMNITPTSGVVHALEQAMEAERERRAEVTKAKAEKEAVSIISEGKRQEAINLSEGEKQKRINESEGKALEISIIAAASAYSIKRVADAMEKPCGDQAAKMRIVEKYIEEFGNIVKGSEVTVVPAQLANIKGFFEGIQKVSATIPTTNQQ